MSENNSAAPEAAEAFDVSAFELEDVGVLEVQNAARTGPLLRGGKPVTIEVYGPGSAQAVEADHKAGRAAQERLARVMRGKPDPKEADKADQEMVDKLALRTRAINNFPIPGGARALYSNPKLGYITKQVIRYADDEANFAKASSTS